MGPLPEADTSEAVALAPPAEDDEAEGDGEADGEEDVGRSFADLLGPDCVIKRVDKDRNVIGGAKPEDMQRELMTRASAQKRIGACAEHVKSMSREEKMRWALDLKDRANEFYSASNFEEAAKLYNDCLVALDLDGDEEQRREVASRLQLPVCTNLAACMIEMGQYARCVEMCDIALSVDPGSCKALYRRGLARYRVGNHASARPDFEAALAGVAAQRRQAAPSAAGGAGEGRGDGGSGGDAEAQSLDDLERRVLAYLGHIRRFTVQERTACKRMFEERPQGLYADRPDAKPGETAEEQSPIDDSDEAIDAALARIRGSWTCCPCRRSRSKAE